jgi:hypothetical protein
MKENPEDKEKQLTEVDKSRGRYVTEKIKNRI